MVLKKSHIIVLIIIYFISPTLAQEPNRVDSIPKLKYDTITLSPKAREHSLLESSLEISLPALALALPYNWGNVQTKQIRDYYTPTFRYHYDDYLQFAPLALQLGLRLTGVQGRSNTLSEMMTANAISLGLMMTTVTLGKHLSKIQRPDGSAHNSFPSGHTAMAFTSATLLHLEYGASYPWLSSLGYLAATSVGIGRILNNRHWLGDVAMGANIGILSAELGYWLSGLIYKKKHSKHNTPLLTKEDLRLSLPWFVALGDNIGFGGLGFGLHYACLNKWNLSAHAELDFTTHSPKLNKTETTQINLRLGIGKSFPLLHQKLSIELIPYFAWNKKDGLYPSFRLVPRWQLSERLSYSLLLGYDYYPKNSTSQVYQRSSVFWAGSAFEIRL